MPYLYYSHSIFHVPTGSDMLNTSMNNNSTMKLIELLFESSLFSGNNLQYLGEQLSIYMLLRLIIGFFYCVKANHSLT